MSMRSQHDPLMHPTRYFSPEKTSSSVYVAWDKALAAEGLYGEEVDQLPVGFSDWGTQMTSKSTRQFFNELGSPRPSLGPARRRITPAARPGWPPSSASGSILPTPPRWRRRRSSR
jgi:hypothetical protein